jgi:hypothetical protein
VRASVVAVRKSFSPRGGLDRVHLALHMRYWERLAGTERGLLSLVLSVIGVLLSSTIILFALGMQIALKPNS